MEISNWWMSIAKLRLFCCWYWLGHKDDWPLGNTFKPKFYVGNHRHVYGWGNYQQLTSSDVAPKLWPNTTNLCSSMGFLNCYELLARSVTENDQLRWLDPSPCLPFLLPWAVTFWTGDATRLVRMGSSPPSSVAVTIATMVASSYGWTNLDQTAVFTSFSKARGLRINHWKLTIRNPENSFTDSTLGRTHVFQVHQTSKETPFSQKLRAPKLLSNNWHDTPVYGNIMCCGKFSFEHHGHIMILKLHTVPTQRITIATELVLVSFCLWLSEVVALGRASWWFQCF